jgi:predicted nucleotide-binding protein with TIR-like domain
VAAKLRDALAEVGVWGVIVSDEPLLSRVGWEPGTKVEAYMNASDAVVALCTADDQLADGTVQTRQNIIDEIRLARERPNLRDKVFVAKAQAVRLPSNINPTYERLDPSDLGPLISLVLRQLREWGVVGERPAEPVVRHPAPAVEQLLAGLALGEWEEAQRRAYSVALTTGHAGLEGTVDALLERVRQGDEAHVPCMLVQSLIEIDPQLGRPTLIEELASREDVVSRMAAAMILESLAIAAPALVPLGLLGRLARPADEDWYVQEPAMKAVARMMARRAQSRVILEGLTGSAEPTDRFAVGSTLLELAQSKPESVPPDLVEALVADRDPLVAAKGREISELLRPLPPDAYDRWRFGL